MTNNIEILVMLITSNPSLSFVLRRGKKVDDSLLNHQGFLECVHVIMVQSKQRSTVFDSGWTEAHFIAFPCQNHQQMLTVTA